MPRFAATTHALDKGVESIKPDAAIKLIEDWEQQLGEVELKGGKTVLRDLGALKKELAKGDKLNGEKVQQLTARLGQSTVKLADQDEKSGDQVRNIGEKLAAVGDAGPDEGDVG
jgi:uncharacterized protein YmfQ (DUF2313 family)